jgi:hypothetical protein
MGFVYFKKREKIVSFSFVYFVFLYPTTMKTVAIAPTAIASSAAPSIVGVWSSFCARGAIRGISFSGFVSSGSPIVVSSVGMVFSISSSWIVVFSGAGDINSPFSEITLLDLQWKLSLDHH